MVNRPPSFPYKLALIHQKFVKISLVRCMQPLSLSHNFQHTFLLYFLPKIWKSNSLKFFGGSPSGWAVLRAEMARQYFTRTMKMAVWIQTKDNFCWEKTKKLCAGLYQCTENKEYPQCIVLYGNMDIPSQAVGLSTSDKRDELKLRLICLGHLQATKIAKSTWRNVYMKKCLTYV